MPVGAGSRVTRMVRYAGVVALALTTIAAGQARAQKPEQGVPNAMQGFSQNRDQPIRIEAASLEMRDKRKEATFAGNVKVLQHRALKRAAEVAQTLGASPDDDAD